jgi:nucleoid DNA-binding protein
MNQQELVNAIARKLYRFSRRDIAEVLEVMLELWAEELTRPEGYLYLHGIGRLYVETQRIPSAGVIREALQEKHGAAAPRQLHRLYFRFRPADTLKQAVLERLAAHE